MAQNKMVRIGKDDNGRWMWEEQKDRKAPEPVVEEPAEEKPKKTSKKKRK